MVLPETGGRRLRKKTVGARHRYEAVREVLHSTENGGLTQALRYVGNGPKMRPLINAKMEPGLRLGGAQK